MPLYQRPPSHSSHACVKSPGKIGWTVAAQGSSLPEKLKGQKKKINRKKHTVLFSLN
jgi:hypothetical protein